MNDGDFALQHVVSGNERDRCPACRLVDSGLTGSLCGVVSSTMRNVILHFYLFNYIKLCPALWDFYGFGRYPDLICRQGSDNVFELLSQLDLDYWTEFHYKVRHRELMLMYGYELGSTFLGRISGSWFLLFVCYS